MGIAQLGSTYSKSPSCHQGDERRKMKTSALAAKHHLPLRHPHCCQCSCWCLLHPLTCPLPSCPFPCSSELESDFNGDSLTSEVSEGQSWLLEPPACSSPIQRWASLIRSPTVPEESPKTSKVADGKQYPDLGLLQ